MWPTAAADAGRTRTPSTADHLSDNGRVSDDGQRIPVSKAAPVLGPKERTLRRRIADGAYQVRQTPLGVLVHVPSEAGHDDWQRPAESGRGRSGAPNSASVGRPPTADVVTLAISEMRALLEQERARSAELEERLRQAEQAAQERVRNLEEDNRRLHAQLALPTPEPPPAPSPPDPVAALRAEVELLRARLEAPRAPWRAFWRRG